MRLPGRAVLLALCAVALCALAAAGPRPLPAIVFVSRAPLPDAADGAIPGFGPHHRASVSGGRLLVREPSGRIRALLPEGALWDASDPAVSPDGKRVAFAGVASADSAWRIFVVALDGGGLEAVTNSDRALDLAPLGAGGERFARYDDLDPCWVSERTLVFASTRYPQRAQYADLPVTNLFRVDLPFGAPRRITSERNGAEEPVFDPERGRLLFARWWYNRWRASDESPAGITAEPRAALPADTANLWHAMEITPEGAELRLAAGGFSSRRTTMAYQPAVLGDGTVVGVSAANTGLSPAPGRTTLLAFAPNFGAPRRLAGEALDDAAGYGGTRGLAAPAACSPAPLPDGRVVFALDPGARGDFGLWAMRADGSGLECLVDLPGTLELDPAPVVHRPRARAPRAAELPAPPSPLPPVRIEPLLHPERGFRFTCLDVFARGRGGESPPATPGARIRFFATLSRPAAVGGDTAVLVREAPVSPGGVVDEAGLPAETPMFEQLVDPIGRVLRSTRGPAHVAGLNAGPAGGTVRCLGCHVGHSTLLDRSGRVRAKRAR